MKNPKTIGVVIGVLVLLGVGFLFVRGPKPVIEIKAETITEIGPFPIVNTWVSAVMAVIVLAIVAFLATRNVSLVPGRLQNLVESVMEAMYNVCVQAAGEKNGRRFFPVVMTILTFIWVANWMALLPFFNAIGTIEKVDAEEFHSTAVVFSKTAGINLIKTNQKALEFDKAEIKQACAKFEAAPAGATAEQVAHLDEQHESCITGQRALAIATKLDQKEATTSGVTSCTGAAGDEAYDTCVEHASETALEQLHEQDKQLGVLIPYFRSMNTDINSPLSIAIMAMIFVEFWGITALGGFKYASKFFNISSPIAFFVGILEFIAEIARIISFTFRLFGNMLAGEILLLVMTFLVPFIVAVPFYGLETFVGFIQAFVFAMLTLVFGVLAVSSHDDHGDHDDEAHAGHGVAAEAAH